MGHVKKWGSFFWFGGLLWAGERVCALVGWRGLNAKRRDAVLKEKEEAASFV